MTIEERLASLERELARAKRRNRWLLAAVGLAVAICAIAWAVMGGAQAVHAEGVAEGKKVIRANAFILEDDNGKPRAALLAGKDGPALTMFDAGRKSGAVLDVTADGPGLALFAAGKPRAGLRVGEDGPTLSLRDQNGVPLALFSVSKEGTALNLYDGSKSRVMLMALKDGPTLILSDEIRKVIWKAP
jgi:hypothetical protein